MVLNTHASWYTVSIESSTGLKWACEAIELFVSITAVLILILFVPTALMMAFLSLFVSHAEPTVPMSSTDIAKGIVLTHSEALGVSDSRAACYGDEREQTCEVTGYREKDLVILKFACKSYKSRNTCELVYGGH